MYFIASSKVKKREAQPTRRNTEEKICFTTASIT